MTRKCRFGRLFNRVPRLGRVLLVLAAVTGLFVAVWMGPAAAQQDLGKYIKLKSAIEVDGGPPPSVWVKVCGPHQGGKVGCTNWEQFGSYVFSSAFAGWYWHGAVTVCRYGTALSVVVPTREQDSKDWFEVDIHASMFGETPSEECLWQP